MIKYILQAKVLNKFRSNKPRGYYHWLKGHTGVDLDYIFEELPTPVSGEVKAILRQPEMGNVVYIADKELGNVHVFAHLDKVYVKVGDQLPKNFVIGLTGNTGGKTTTPHLHYEVITFQKPSSRTPSIYDNLFSSLMTRKLGTFVGWNIDPIAYLRILYGKYRFNANGEYIKE